MVGSCGQRSKAVLTEKFKAEPAGGLGFIGLIRREGVACQTEQLFDVFANDIAFDVDEITGLVVADDRLAGGMGNDRDGEIDAADGGDGQADAIQGDGSFGEDVFEQIGCSLDLEQDGIVLRGAALDRAGAVNVAADDVAAEPVRQAQRALEIDRAALADRAQARPAQGFGHDIGGKRAVGQIDGSQADAIDGDAVANSSTLKDLSGPDGEADFLAAAVDGLDGAHFFDDTSEHQVVLSGGVPVRE